MVTGNNFVPYSLEDILQNHSHLVKGVLSKISPGKYLTDYLHHGYYPFFLENRNFEENLLKTMNMMTEVDILLIKQIELKYLTKIKKLLYLLAVAGIKAPNISQLAHDIETSRATVMNYIEYLSEARLLNIIYPVGQKFPKKPAKVMMHNPNLTYAIYPNNMTEQDVMETFFVNTIWKNHQVSQGAKPGQYIIDNKLKFRVCDANNLKTRYNNDCYYARYNTEVGSDNRIPLWLFGFLY